MDTKELDFFKKQIESYINKARMGSVVVTTFLDETQQAIINTFYTEDIDVIYDGGFIGAESKRVIFKPYSIDQVDSKICIYKIIYNKRYLEINHRNILGSLMSLGIKRENIGDIVIQNEQAFFACTEEISQYLKNYFKTIGRMSIELIEYNEQIEIIKDLKIENHIISSLRIDVIIASAFKMSRSEANEMIIGGLVKLNHLICTNTSKNVKLDDVISVRHKGRVYLTDIGGKTRSDRIVVKLGFLK